MVYAAITDASGRIQRTLAASLPEHLALQIDATAPGRPAGWTVRDAPALLDLATAWWDGSGWAPRPAPPAPPALAAGVAALWTSLPPGAVVTVDALNGAAPAEATVGEDGTLSLTLPAWTWRISVNEVFPALAASWDVEVAP